MTFYANCLILKERVSTYMRIRVGGTDREAPGSAGEGLSFMESSNKKELMEADIKVKSLVKAGIPGTESRYAEVQPGIEVPSFQLHH